MSSLSEEATKYAAVIVTGGSSGIGKSFIELMQTMNPGVLICNLSRREPAINLSQLNLSHVPCDLSRAEEIISASAKVRDLVEAHAPTGPILLINNSGFGAYGHCVGDGHVVVL